LGAGLSKRKAFLQKKKYSDKAQVHPFAVSTRQNHIVLDDCCGTPFCTETALVHHALLCFDFFFFFWLIFRW